MWVSNGEYDKCDGGSEDDDDERKKKKVLWLCTRVARSGGRKGNVEGHSYIPLQFKLSSNSDR